MRLAFDRDFLWLGGGVFALLVLATIIGRFLKVRGGNEGLQATIDNVNARIRAWWVMCLIFAVALLTGKIGSVVLFGLVSFLALREFITLTPTHVLFRTTETFGEDPAPTDADKLRILVNIVKYYGTDATVEINDRRNG